MNKKEVKTGDEAAVHFPGGGQIHVRFRLSHSRSYLVLSLPITSKRFCTFSPQCEGVPNSGDKKSKLFSYNVVFEPAASQEDVLQFSGIKKLIEMAVEGFSTTAFCYGQTGSGKTHTLTGPPGLVRITLTVLRN